jgi:hypothetical protein
VSYDRTCGRLRVRVCANGARMHDYGHGVAVACRAGWNDGCPMVEHTMSVEELHDLRHLIDRAIAAVSPNLTRAAEIGG